MFGRLAMESGLVTHEEIVSCVEMQDRIRAEGGTPPKLGELLIERGILSQEEVDTILRMQSNPGGLIGRQLVENNLVTREQLRQCLDEQAEYHRTGRIPPRLGEMVVQKGWVKPDDLKLVLRKKESPGHLFGEFLVSHNLVGEQDIKKCLAMQKDTADPAGKAPRLGDMLVQCGILRKEQVELYSRRHLQAKKVFTAATSQTRTLAKRRDSRVMRGDLLIVDTLGQHFDGVTYKATHTTSGAVVAAHFFADAEPEGEAGAEFEHKCRQAAKIRHPAVQPLFAVDVFNSRRVLTAEFIDGATLGQILDQEGRIEWLWAFEMICDFAEVLALAAGLGIAHDDIRPGAVLVDYSGRARLGLWAYTRDSMANREWLAKRHKKVPFYHAPERLRSGPNQRSDMFSLGMTLIHAVTGRSVLKGASFSEALRSSTPADAAQNMAIDMTLPLGFVAILARMVEADPENRFPDFNALLQALNAFRDEQGIDINIGRAAIPEPKDMDAGQASRIIARFLKSDMASTSERKVSMMKLAKFYAGPIAAMLVLMLLTTAVYRTTQASHGLMVRANWRDLQGDKAGALQLYRIISTLYPKNETIQRRYYDLAMEVGDHGEAEIALERLMPLHPENRAKNLELQADLQVWQNRFLSAVDIYRKVLANRPHDVALRAKLANALLWAQSYPEAQKEFADLVALDPASNALTLGLARAAAGNKDLDTASRMFDQLNRQGMLTQDMLMEYAWLLHDSGRNDQLKTLADSALRRKETQDYKVNNLVNLYLWAGNYAEAGKLLDRLSPNDLRERDLLDMRITINDKLGNTQAVIDDYKRLAGLNPADPEPLLVVAGHYQGMKNFAEADNYFRQALARSPDSVNIMNAIARNQVYMGNFAEAEKWFRSILAKNAVDKPAIHGLVQALLETNKYAEAQQYVERLYRENPNDRQNRVNLAIVYTWLGKAQEAIPVVDGLIADGLLTDGERDVLAVNAMRAEANDLLLRLVGATEGDTEKINEYRLILARRLRGQGKHAIALPLYAAVVSSTPMPGTALLMEAAETANWAGRHDIAASWLEMAAAIAAGRQAMAQGGSGAAPSQTAAAPQQRFRLSEEAWNSLLEPLRRDKGVYDSLSGFQKRFSKAAPSETGTAKL